jgi:hypothetical protein
VHVSLVGGGLPQSQPARETKRRSTKVEGRTRIAEA